jgi:hypothetical protein
MEIEIEIEFSVEDCPEDEVYSARWQAVPRIGEMVCVPDYNDQDYEEWVSRRVVALSWGVFVTGSRPTQPIPGKASVCITLSKEKAF